MHSKGRDFVRQAGQVHSVISAWDLGLGESEVLAWANERPGWEAILDDKAARDCAASPGNKNSRHNRNYSFGKKRKENQ
jgi:hypothetical protein